MKIIELNNKIINYIFMFVFLANFAITKLFSRGFLLQEILIIALIIINILYNRSIKFFMFLYLSIFIPIVLNINNLTNAEFIKSYILFLIYSMFVFITITVGDKEKCINYYLIGIEILVLFGVFQFVIRLLNINILSNFANDIFGQYTIAENLMQSSFYGIPRVNSLLYEPSIFGMICLSGVGMSLYIRGKKFDCYRYKYFLLSIIGVIISFSTIAIIGLALIILVRILLVKKNILLKYFILIGGGTTVLIIINMFWIRINEIFTLGTSGYYRIIAPIRLIIDMFKSKYIFGIGMGQLESYILRTSPPYMLKYGYEGWGLGFTVDNSIFMLILTFGIAIIPILIYLFSYIIRRINIDNIAAVIVFIIVAIGTGGYNFIYFNIVLTSMLLTLKDEKNVFNNQGGI